MEFNKQTLPSGLISSPRSIYKRSTRLPGRSQAQIFVSFIFLLLSRRLLSPLTLSRYYHFAECGLLYFSAGYSLSDFDPQCNTLVCCVLFIFISVMFLYHQATFSLVEI